MNFELGFLERNEYMYICTCSCLYVRGVSASHLEHLAIRVFKSMLLVFFLLSTTFEDPRHVLLASPLLKPKTKHPPMSGFKATRRGVEAI